jgi:integrase
MGRRPAEPRINLTDRFLRGLAKKPAAQGKHYDKRDSIVPGLMVRVSDTGRRTFVVLARFPSSANPTRRAIGEYGVVTLDEARKTTRQWLDHIKRGIDPKQEKERRKAAALKHRNDTLTTVAEAFITEKLSKERRGREAERDLRNVFIARWGDRPLAEITDLDVLALIKAKVKGGPVYARNLLALAKRFFGWAVDQRIYGLQNSPCERIRPRGIFGERVARQRKLTDAELFALWRVALRTPYPYGPVYKLLLLTGLRLNEVARAQKSEFDKQKGRWIVPAARMTTKNCRARDHAVPLTSAIRDIVDQLPNLDGAFVFSNDNGKKAAWIGNKIKKDIDRRMLLTLRALAKADGEDPRKVKLEYCKTHDLRRNVRSGLSTLRVPLVVAEAILDLTAGTIRETHNVDDLFDQKAEALELWATHLKAVTSARSHAVKVRAVPLKDAGAERPRARFAERAAWLARAADNVVQLKR